jgi:hypothetical protein
MDTAKTESTAAEYILPSPSSFIYLLAPFFGSLLGIAHPILAPKSSLQKLTTSSPF